jgi:hypothetical protein
MIFQRRVALPVGRRILRILASTALNVTNANQGRPATRRAIKA